MATHKGSFVAKGTDKVWEYETVTWQREGGEPQVDIELTDLFKTGELTVKIIDPDDKNFVAYQTVQLPWESWEQVEYVLAMDWGEEGSRGPS